MTMADVGSSPPVARQTRGPPGLRPTPPDSQDQDIARGGQLQDLGPFEVQDPGHSLNRRLYERRDVPIDERLAAQLATTSCW